MKLEEQTNLIKHYCKTAKSNFIKIGKILKEIKEEQLYKEAYISFEDYVLNSGFDFGRQYAYKLISVYDTFGKNVALCDKLSISKLIQLTYVPDREIREEIATRAINESWTKERVEKEVKEVKRLRTDKKPNLSTLEEEYYKCLNEYEKLSESLKMLISYVSEVLNKTKAWKERAKNFERLEDNIKAIDGLVNAVKKVV